jgi:hypothetical protein
MAFAYTGEHSIASSFCERMDLAAGDALTDARTLLDERELESSRWWWCYELIAPSWCICVYEGKQGTRRLWGHSV